METRSARGLHRISQGVTALSGAALGKEMRFTVANTPLTLRATAGWGAVTAMADALPPNGWTIVLESNYRLDPKSLRADLVSEGEPIALGPVTEPE